MTARIGALLWHWLPVVVWMGLILSLSGRSDLPVRHNPQTGEVIRTTFTMAKVAHVVEYVGLALLLLRALVGAGGGVQLPLRAAVLVAAVVATGFGAVDELRQAFTPSREPRLFDVALDGASALAAGLAMLGWRRYLHLRGGALTDTDPRPTAGRWRRPATRPLPSAGADGSTRG